MTHFCKPGVIRILTDETAHGRFFPGDTEQEGLLNFQNPVSSKTKVCNLCRPRIFFMTRPNEKPA